MPRLITFKSWRIIGALLAAVFLTACSGLVQTAYNSAQTLVYLQLDRRLDFDESQEKRVRDDLAKLHAWHRKSELPTYVQWLAQLQREVAADTTPAAVCAHWNQAVDAWSRVLAQAEPSIAALAPTLSASQIRRLEADFAKRNQAWRKTWMDGSRDKQIEKRTQRVVTHARRLYGELDEAQIEMVRTLLNEQKFQTELSLRENLRRQAEGLNLIRQSIASPDRASALVKTYFAQSMTSPDATYRNYSEKMREASCTLLARLHNNTTSAQRARAVRVLKGYEADLRALVSQSS